MNKYAFRAIAANFTKGVQLLIALGVLAEHEGQTCATENGGWRYLGKINRIPTGTYDEDGKEILGPVCDAQGNEYLHANLDTPFNLKAIAEAHSDDPEVASVLASLEDWILTDSEGRARLPNNPVEVIFEV